MKFVENVFINRPPATVWAFLEHPANMPLWNPKVNRVSPSSFAGPQQGYSFAITYQMHERVNASEFLAEFVHFEPPIKLTYTPHRGPLSSQQRHREDVRAIGARRGNLSEAINPYRQFRHPFFLRTSDLADSTMGQTHRQAVSGNPAGHRRKGYRRCERPLNRRKPTNTRSTFLDRKTRKSPIRKGDSSIRPPESRLTSNKKPVD